MRAARATRSQGAAGRVAPSEGHPRPLQLSVGLGLGVGDGVLRAPFGPQSAWAQPSCSRPTTMTQFGTQAPPSNPVPEWQNWATAPDEVAPR